jgi:PAS domain S-box-containing protein
MPVPADLEWIQARAGLGLALGARADDVVAGTYQRLARYTAPREFNQALDDERRLRTHFGTLLIARWLITGEAASEEESAWISQRGRWEAAEGALAARTSRGYYCWRDTVVEILREEASRLGTPAGVLETAIDVTRASCDASLLGILREYDLQVRLINENLQAANQELAASERRFRGLFEAMACGVLVVSPQGRVTDFNDAALTILELSAEALRGASVFDPAIALRDESGAELRHPPSALAIRTKQPVRGRIVKLGARNGSPERWLQTEAVPTLGPSGDVIEIVTSFVDVTGVKEAEEARAESEAKSRFLAHMSHELRTPLNAVLGFAQLLRMHGGDRLDQHHLRYLDNIEVGGQHLLAVINDILDLSKVAAGQLRVAKEDVAIDTLLEELCAEFQPLAHDKGLALVLDVSSGLHVCADRLRCRQILVNLIANALKFTAHGSVHVIARADAGWAEISVSDTGMGIPPEYLDRVFDEFTQVDSGFTRDHGGTGLGLPLAKRLVEVMGGTLSLESTVAKGTTARIRLARTATLS